MANENEDDKTSKNTPAAGEYGVDQMRYMSDLEHVRERTGMYIGNRDVRGMHHLVTEVVDNSIDEVMAGYAKVVNVTVNRDGSVTVEDDGRGIPVDVDPSIGKSGPGGRHDDAQVRRQVRQQGLQNLRRPPRHRCQGRQFPVASGARSRSAAAATSITRNTSAASRSRRCEVSAPRTRPAPRPLSSPITKSSAT